MADVVADVVKLLLVPGTTTFLLLAVSVGVLLTLLSSPRARRLGAIALAFVLTLYWMLSLPVVADLLANRFQPHGPTPLPKSAVRGADAIVVLGAGVATHRLNGYQASVPDRQTIFNAFEGARVFHLAEKPVPVVASGGIVNAEWQREPESVVIRDLLVRAGVPQASIILDSSSRTTHEQAVTLARMIRQHQWKRVIVVAPSVQMPRAVGSFALEGIRVLPAEASFHSDDGTTGQPGWIPTGDALTVSSRAAYDYLGWFYYWARGWLASQPTSLPASAAPPG